MDRRRAAAAVTTAVLACPPLALAVTAQAEPAIGQMAAGASAERRAPQMTQREFRRIKPGMSPSQVRRIVGSTGRLEYRTSSCFVRSYSVRDVFPDSRAQVQWERYDEDGYEVTQKRGPRDIGACPGEV